MGVGYSPLYIYVATICENFRVFCRLWSTHENFSLETLSYSIIQWSTSAIHKKFIHKTATVAT